MLSYSLATRVVDKRFVTLTSESYTSCCCSSLCVCRNIHTFCFNTTCCIQTIDINKMAFSAHKDPEQVREFFDDAAALSEKAGLLADWIRQSNHFVAFTGAGISTSAGISDFRGPQGVWTLRAQGKNPTRGVSTAKALPTKSHMALVELERRDVLKFLISQNCDGLHRRSGFSADKLAELHGNSNLDNCRTCGRTYLRDFRCRMADSVHEHRTGWLFFFHQQPLLNCSAQIISFNQIFFGQYDVQTEFQLQFLVIDVSLCVYYAEHQNKFQHVNIMEQSTCNVDYNSN